jgi:hypothetical protein
MVVSNKSIINKYKSFDLSKNKKFAQPIQIAAITYFPKYTWTTSYTIEQVHIELISTICVNDGITLRYEKRAKWLIRRISIWRPPPDFIIYRKDLSKRVLAELQYILKFSPETVDYIMKKAIEMIFMGLAETEEPVFNREYYLWSIKPYNLLKWRFDRKEDQETDPDSKYNINYFCYDSNGNEIGRIKDKIMEVF